MYQQILLSATYVYTMSDLEDGLFFQRVHNLAHEIKLIYTHQKIRFSTGIQSIIHAGITKEFKILKGRRKWGSWVGNFSGDMACTKAERWKSKKLMYICRSLIHPFGL